MPAGSQVQGLRMMLLDERGLPAEQAVAGKITASWKKGSKKVSWKGEAIKLPSFQVRPVVMLQDKNISMCCLEAQVNSVSVCFLLLMSHLFYWIIFFWH